MVQTFPEWVRQAAGFAMDKLDRGEGVLLSGVDQGRTVECILEQRPNEAFLVSYSPATNGIVIDRP